MIEPDFIVWVCGDCYAAHYFAEPLAKLPYVYDGDPVHWFDFTCSNHDVDEPEDTCPHCGRSGHESGIDTFSWSPCDGCGSHLGGARYRLAGFIRKEATT